jgi:hypothetical protein
MKKIKDKEAYFYQYLLCLLALEEYWLGTVFRSAVGFRFTLFEPFWFGPVLLESILVLSLDHGCHLGLYSQDKQICSSLLGLLDGGHTDTGWWGLVARGGAKFLGTFRPGPLPRIASGRFRTWLICRWAGIHDGRTSYSQLFCLSNSPAASPSSMSPHRKPPQCCMR